MITITKEHNKAQLNKKYEFKNNRNANYYQPECYRKLLEWIIDNDEWTTFTITITFKNLQPIEFHDGYKKAAIYEYKKNVLTKIKKRLCRLCSKWNSVIPLEHFFQYEYGQGSFFKKVTSTKSIPHIHGIFPVAKSSADRIYDFKNSKLDKRLTKDLRSLKHVATFEIEPLRTDEANDWLNYMFKGKSLKDLDS